MSVYEVIAVKDRKEWSGNFGPMVTYVMDVEDEDGMLSPKVELNRKPESREPQIGERFAGHLEETNFAEKLKVDFEQTKELNQGARRPSGGSTESKTSNNSKGDVDWDKRNAEIRRQHSEEMALRVLIGMDELKGVHDATEAQSAIAGWADWFDQDAIEAGQEASQGQLPSPSGAGESQTAAPEQSSADLDFTGARKQEPGTVDRDHIMQLLSSAGLVYAGAQEKVADYILTQLSVAGREKAALTGLQDLDRQGTVLAQLEKETEKWLGSPLPQGDALDGDDSIPF